MTIAGKDRSISNKLFNAAMNSGKESFRSITCAAKFPHTTIIDFMFAGGKGLPNRLSNPPGSVPGGALHPTGAYPSARPPPGVFSSLYHMPASISSLNAWRNRCFASPSSAGGSVRCKDAASSPRPCRSEKSLFLEILLVYKRRRGGETERATFGERPSQLSNVLNLMHTRSLFATCSQTAGFETSAPLCPAN